MPKFLEPFSALLPGIIEDVTRFHSRYLDCGQASHDLCVRKAFHDGVNAPTTVILMTRGGIRNVMDPYVGKPGELLRVSLGGPFFPSKNQVMMSRDAVKDPLYRHAALAALDYGMFLQAKDVLLCAGSDCMRDKSDLSVPSLEDYRRKEISSERAILNEYPDLPQDTAPDSIYHRLVRHMTLRTMVVDSLNRIHNDYPKAHVHGFFWDHNQQRVHRLEPGTSQAQLKATLPQPHELGPEKSSETISPTVVLRGCAEPRANWSHIRSEPISSGACSLGIAGIIPPFEMSHAGHVHPWKSFGTLYNSGLRKTVVMGHDRCGGIGALVEALQSQGATPDNPVLRWVLVAREPAIEALLYCDRMNILAHTERCNTVARGVTRWSAANLMSQFPDMKALPLHFGLDYLQAIPPDSPTIEDALKGQVPLFYVPQVGTPRCHAHSAASWQSRRPTLGEVIYQTLPVLPTPDKLA